MLVAAVLWAFTASAKPRLMATLPAGTVLGIDEELSVFEDLTNPGAPTLFKVSRTLRLVGRVAAQQATDLGRGHRGGDPTSCQDPPPTRMARTVPGAP